MGILYCLLLIVMGLLAAQDFIRQKVPALGGTLNALNSYAEFIGLAGIILGILWLFNSLRMLSFLGSHPILVLEVWLVSFLTLALGLILGWDMLKKIVGEPGPAFFVKIGVWREKLVAHKKELGLAGIVLGIIYLF